MKHNMKFQVQVITFIILFMTCMMSVKSYAADSLHIQDSDGVIDLNFDEEGKTYLVGGFENDRDYFTCVSTIYFICQYSTQNKFDVSVESSNSKVAIIDYDDQSFQMGEDASKQPLSGNVKNRYDIGLRLLSFGKTTVTITVKGQSISKDFYVVPYWKTKIESATKISNTKVQLNWNPTVGVDGYIIRRAKHLSTKKYVYSDSFHPNGYSEWEDIMTISDSSVTTCVVPVDDTADCKYAVLGYMNTDGTTVYFPYDEKTGIGRLSTVHYSVTYDKPQIFAFSTKNKVVTLGFQAITDAIGYRMYMAKGSNAQYKLQKTYSPNDVMEYQVKIQAGAIYHFRVDVEYANGVVASSDIRKAFVPIKTNKTDAKIVSKIKQWFGYGSYWDGNYAKSDITYYYENAGKFHVVNVDKYKRTIQDVTLDAKMNYVSQKLIKLDKFEQWGGYYHAANGKHYVVVGDNNIKEKKDKTVIKVYQYDKQWKKKRRCDIKADVKNVFDGISEPFRAGNCRMDMIGKTLYIFTCRTMFKQEDGLNHQSDIAFQIDTETMQYANKNNAYVSHSFNQFVAYQDGSLYQVDHGDANPRAVVLTISDGYETNGDNSKEYELLKIKGGSGDNYTGVFVGGMGIGKTNVLVTGSSTGQNYKIGGKKGNTKVKNIFLSVTNRKTGKTNLKWITTNNPAKSKIQVGEVRLVTISEDRFALLYNVTNGENETLHYVLVDENGKKKKEKTYKELKFDASSQPILYNGYIQWTCACRTANQNMTTKVCRIPAK